VGLRRDHRPLRALADEAAEQASADLRVALGLLDARHLAGDPNLTLRLRSALLTQWRRDARERLPELHRLVTGRGDLIGELAHSSVPDLKESVGGLRDATVLKALVASWLVDVPHVDLERSRGALLDVRDALQAWPGAPPTGWCRSTGRTWRRRSAWPTRPRPSGTPARSAAGSRT
jgi:[protein-PII] uridylyltransferase